MVVTMDLNVSPVPEDDEENFEEHIEEFSAPEERFETGVETARRVFLNFAFWCPEQFAVEECALLAWIVSLCSKSQESQRL